MDHADDCLICSRERKAAMRSFGPTAGSRSLLLGDRAEKGFCHDVESRCRPIARVAIATLMSLGLAFVMMAIAETPADARRVRHKRSTPTKFVGRPDDQPLTDFKCYCVGSTAQYFCQETRTNKPKDPPIGFALEAENPGDVGLFPRESPPVDINANNSIRPRRFSCKGSGTDPAANSTYRYYGGRTFSFKLDNAMAIIVEDDKTNEISIDTWFMPRYK
jgi:hypothetical protein